MYHGLGAISVGMKSEKFPMQYFGSQIMCGHTRNASVGATNIDNAHPFTIGGIVGAHNGRVSNFWELKNKYKEKYPEVDKFDVDSQIIFWLLDTFGKDGLSQVEGRASAWWIDESEMNRINLWVWNQDLHYSLKPFPAFSSDGEHLKVAGFSDVVKLKPDGQIAFFDTESVKKGFYLDRTVSGVVPPPVITSARCEEDWIGEFGHSTGIHGFLPHSHDESTRADSEWDVKLHKYVKTKYVESLLSDNGADGTEEEKRHRILLVRAQRKQTLYKCNRCHAIVSDADTEKGDGVKAFSRRHKFCEGFADPLTAYAQSLLQEAAAKIISIKLGVDISKETPGGEFTIAQVREFITGKKPIIEEKKPEEKPEGKQLQFPEMVVYSKTEVSICDSCGTKTCPFFGKSSVKAAECSSYTTRAANSAEYTVSYGGTSSPLCPRCASVTCSNHKANLRITGCKCFSKNLCMMCLNEQCSKNIISDQYDGQPHYESKCDQWKKGEK